MIVFVPVALFLTKTGTVGFVVLLRYDHNVCSSIFFLHLYGYSLTLNLFEMVAQYK